MRENRAGIFVTRDDSSPARPGELPNLTGKDLGGRYKIEEHLGTGGFGAVYAALDGGTRQKIALKIVVAPTDSEESKHSVEQILQEYKLRQKINDFTHVIKCDDPRECDLNGLSLILLPMELAADGSFRRWLQANADTENRRTQAIAFFRQACLGVSAIHSAGQAHLDLKPENILIKDGKAKITDFGIGRFVTRTHGCNPEHLVRSGMGTPCYMSPEQFETARQQDIGPLSDIYSLGVILFEVLDGAPPFDGSHAELQKKHQSLAPPPLDGAASAWAGIVERCLAKAPSRRYANVDELISDLDRVQHGAAAGVDVACPTCSRINANPEHKVCVHCQTSLTSLFRPCPKCAKEVRLDVQTCAGCGESVLDYYVRLDRWATVNQLRVEDPVEAISLLEQMLREGAKELSESCLAELKRLREDQKAISNSISAADRAVIDGNLDVALDNWRAVLELAPRHRVAAEKARSIDQLLNEFRENHAKGLSLADHADFDGSMGCLRRCLELIPQSAEVKSKLDDILRRSDSYRSTMQAAYSARDAKQLTNARDILLFTVFEAPKSPDAIALSSMLDAAIRETEELLQLVKDNINRGLFDEAEAGLLTIENCHTDFEALDETKLDFALKRSTYAEAMTKCEQLLEARDLEPAVDAVGHALSVCPESPQALALQKQLQEDIARARQHLERSRDLRLAADFSGSVQELTCARRFWATMPQLVKAECETKETQAAYERHIASAERGSIRGLYRDAHVACEKAEALCPKAEKPPKLRHRICEEFAEVQSRLEQREKQASERRAKRRQFLKNAAMTPIVLLALGMLIRLAWSYWNEPNGPLFTMAVEHRNWLLGVWGGLIIITTCIHRARFTNYFHDVLVGQFGSRTDRMDEAWFVAAALLLALSGVPGAGVFWVSENLIGMTREASISLGAACAIFIQFLAIIHAITSRCRWRLE